MNFEFSDEQNLLREQALGFLQEQCPMSRVRAVLDGDAAYDAELWTRIAELGWTATAIPEQYGGLGLSYLELSVIAEELGRAVAPVPFSSSVYLATEAILMAGSERAKGALAAEARDGRGHWYLRSRRGTRAAVPCPPSHGGPRREADRCEDSSRGRRHRGHRGRGRQGGRAPRPAAMVRVST